MLGIDDDDDDDDGDADDDGDDAADDDDDGDGDDDDDAWPRANFTWRYSAFLTQVASGPSAQVKTYPFS